MHWKSQIDSPPIFSEITETNTNGRNFFLLESWRRKKAFYEITQKPIEYQEVLLVLNCKGILRFQDRFNLLKCSTVVFSV